MIYLFLGSVVRRAWFFLLAGWVILVLAVRHAAPPWSELSQDKQFGFLPEDAPSRRAEAMTAKAFPDDQSASNIVLVLHGSNPGRLDQDLKFVQDILEPGLRKIAEAEGGLSGEQLVPANEPLFSDEALPIPAPKPKPPSIIYRIRTPNAPGAGALLVSPDREAMLVVVELTTEFTSRAAWPVIDRVEDLVGDLRRQGKVPAGTEIAISGSAVIGRDHSQAELRSARATSLLTVVLVVVLLLLIYRAPLLALIPLATVYLAVQGALGILAILAGQGWITVFQGLEIYITILAYGAGVDYSLFLTARYKEELDRGASPPDAVVAAVGGVGAALTASAATVICGISMMMFARFGKFREAGVAIPICLAMVLLATLTFSSALLRLTGRWAFWPYHRTSGDGTEPDSHGWKSWLTGGALRRAWDLVGHALLRRPGVIWLATVAVMAPFAVVAGRFYNHLSYDFVANMPAEATSVVGTRVLQKHFPPGMLGTSTVLLVTPDIDFAAPEGHALVARLTEQLDNRKTELGLADVRSLTAPLGNARPASGNELNNEVREAVERAAREHYVTDLGERAKIGTRLELVLATSPFSRQGIDDLSRTEQDVRDALPPAAREDAQLYSVGTTASVRDLATVIGEDRTRIELLVVASVFVILVLLLHRLVVPIYLLLSVLFSYYVTLGVTFMVFYLLDPHGFMGIDWQVAIFLFTILIAVGEDYNILLMARVHEEEKQYGTPRGIQEALTRTGPIISSCGIIMAGTFASLLAGSLTEMKQLGFALAFGVLLDTFVVRPILVPAFLVLQRTGRLSPAVWMRQGASLFGAQVTKKAT